MPLGGASLRAILFGVFVAFSRAAIAFDPIVSIVGMGISTSMDARTAGEVKNDIQIDVALTKKLLDHKGDDFKNVSALVFAQHVVLIGYARNGSVRRQAGALAKPDKLIRSLRNDILIGKPDGNFGANLVLDKKIGLALTAARGISSVNMRWKVYGGAVFLAGVAQSPEEARLAAATIRSLGGVKKLRPHLRIVRKKK
ncbi:MAG: BON domain-containing protein [Nitrosomonadales bacterium]|nr:BON domain-containing protein [Nitrosomonadales bacterium]